MSSLPTIAFTSTKITVSPHKMPKQQHYVVIAHWDRRKLDLKNRDNSSAEHFEYQEQADACRRKLEDEGCDWPR